MVAEVPVDEPVHQAVPEGLELLRRVELGDALPAVRVAHGIEEFGDGNVDRSGEGAVFGRRPVHVELPLVKPRGVDVESQEVIGRTRRRRRRAVEIRREDAELVTGVEGDHRRRRSREHRGPVERVGAALRARRTEHVERHVVGIGPDAELSVVGEEVVARLELVLPVGPGRVVRGRDREALVEGTVGVVRQRELRKHPPVGLAVVPHERVAVVLDLAGAAEARPERVAGKGAEDDRARLVVDRRDAVDVLDVVAGSDVALRVGRHDAQTENGGVVVVGGSVEIGERLGLREAEPLLDHRVGRRPGDGQGLSRGDLVRDLAIRADRNRSDESVVGEARRFGMPRRKCDGGGPFACEDRLGRRREGAGRDDETHRDAKRFPVHPESSVHFFGNARRPTAPPELSVPRGPGDGVRAGRGAYPASNRFAGREFYEAGIRTTGSGTDTPSCTCCSSAPSR